MEVVGVKSYSDSVQLFLSILRTRMRGLSSYPHLLEEEGQGQSEHLVVSRLNPVREV
jgi:hypothetical protein